LVTVVVVGKRDPKDGEREGIGEGGRCKNVGIGVGLKGKGDWDGEREDTGEGGS